MDLDDEVPARRCLEKGGPYKSIVDPPPQKEALDLYPGAVKSPGEPSVDPPLGDGNVYRLSIDNQVESILA